MSKLSAFLLVLALTISAFAPTNIGASSGVNAPMNSSEPFCGDTTTVDLLRNSNKKLDSGEVTVANGETTLFVTYTTASPWTLVQTDLAVAASLADIPVTNKGNPKVDQFPYRSSHAGVTTYTYEIPLGDLGVGPGDTLVVAAHADLRKTGSTKTEGAWSDGTEFVPGKRSWGTYFTYTVQVCNEPPTAVDDAYSVDEDNTLNVAAPGVLANDTDPESDPLTAVPVSNPTNGTLTLNADGSFSYTPNANFNGSDSFTYQANDGTSDSNVATVNITVNPINDAPVANNDSYSTNEDTALNVPAPGVLLNDAHPDGNPITAILVSGPAHGTLTFNADGSFTYTPALNYNGADSFTYKANDGAFDSNIATVNITLDPVNDAPVATDDAYNTIEDTVLNVPAPGVLANDTDIDGDSLSAVLVSGPAHGSLTLNPNGSFVYTPDVDYNGPDSFTYKANDGQADSNVATVNITITPPNAAPVADDDAYSVDEDNPLNVAAPGVLANDGDSDGDPITAVLVSGPADGTLTLNADGSFSYTPDVNFNGSDSFTYKANDGTADSNIATVSITVNPVNDAPVAVDDAYNTDEDTPLNVTAPGVLANDSDVDGDPLSAVLVTTTSNGTLTLNADGSFSYTPDANFNGSDSFTYTANDGALDSNVATVDITVNAVTDDPTAVNDTATVAEDSAATTIDVLANDINTDGSPISIASVTQPDNGTVVITNAGADLTYQPDANTCNGGSPTDDFTYSLDPGGSTATVAVTVTCVDDAPTAVDDTATILEDAAAMAIDVLANDTDTDGGPKSITSVTQPTNGTVVITGGGTGLTYQPNANYCNNPPGTTPDTFSYTLTPGGSTATVAVTVTCVDDPPTAVNDTSTMLEDAAATSIAVLANDTDIDGGPAFTIASVTQPANGTAVITGGGTGLTYQPNANYCNGGSPTDNFTYTLTPGGSTATVAVTVTCVNDAPSFTKGADQTVDEDAGAQIVNGWATGISAGPNEGGQTVTFIIDSNDNPSLFSAGPAVASNGTLTYTPAANQNGVANITLHVADNGGTANGGVDSSGTQSFVITVNAVNDAPVALTKTGSAHTNMKIVGVTPGLLTGVTDADTGVNGCSPTFTVASITSNTGGTVSNVNLAAGSFDFDPAPGFTGTAVVNYTVQDNGCPGTATSAPAAINITVSGPVIWFVNPAGAAGDGRLSNPFNTLTAAAAVDAAGHSIFVYTGTATGSIALNTNEWLIGQGVTGTTFDALFPITPPAGTIARPSINGTRPVIQGNVAMATSDVVRGLNIQPASGTAGLTASGATSLTVNEVTVITSNAVAVSLLNSDGTFSFTRIDAIGGSNGIVWSNASPATGSFTVIGDGTNTSVGGNGTGGIIANMSGSDGTTNGIGIYLNNARNVTLRRMHINGTNQNYGIRGNLVNGFTLEYSTVDGTNGTASSLPAPNNAGEGSVYFGDASTTGLTGSATFTNVQISGGRARNFSVINHSGTLNRLTITGSTFGLNQNFSNANDSLSLEARNSGTILNVTVTGSTFLGAPGDLAEFVGQQLTTMDVVFQNNTLTNSHAQNIVGGGGLTLATAGTMTFNVTGNTMRGAHGSAVTLFKAGALSGTPSMSGVFSSNTIGVSGVAGSGSMTGNGIFVSAGGTGTMSYTITNNTILQYLGNAAIYADNTGGSYTANFTITGNTAAQPGANVFAGLAITNGSPGSGDTINVCADIKTNDFSAAEPSNSFDIIVGASGAATGHTFNLPGYVGGANLANVQSFIQNNNLNPGTTAVNAYTDAPATAAAFTGVGTTCSTP